MEGEASFMEALCLGGETGLVKRTETVGGLFHSPSVDRLHGLTNEAARKIPCDKMALSTP